MTATVLSSSLIHFTLNSQYSQCLMYSLHTFSILQIGKLRHGQVKKTSQGHMLSQSKAEFKSILKTMFFNGDTLTVKKS